MRLTRPASDICLLLACATAAIWPQALKAKQLRTAELQPSRTTVYDAAFFSSYAPRTALDIVNRIPGFSLDPGSADVRGFAGAAGNVVLNGERPTTKSQTLDVVLGQIPAGRVKRVEVGPGALYGADYASKTQVANLILAAASGLGGNVTLSGSRGYNGYITPNASGTVELSRGKSTFNLSGDTGRSDFFDKGFDRVTDVETGELIVFRRKANRDLTRAPSAAISWALEEDDSKSAHLNARYSFNRRHLTQTSHVTTADGDERDDFLLSENPAKTLELGGDVSRPLAGGALKLVGLLTRRHQHTRDDSLVGNLGGTEIVGGFEQVSGSHTDESIAKLSWSRARLLGFKFEAGGELARNKLQDALDLFQLDQGGTRTRVDLPLDNATVSELRGELYVNAGRPLTNRLRADLGLNYEFSHLTVRGDATADRKLKFLKPSVTLDWEARGGWHGQLILRRTVAQLDFFDFISAAELSVGRVNGGNANLQPQRTWEVRLSLEHPVFGTGKVRMELGYDLVSRLQDRILVVDQQGEAFDAPGNLGTGRRRFVDLTFDSPLDRLWKGLRARLHGGLVQTRVRDPISGDERDFSGVFPRWNWDADVRRDVGKFAYGFTIGDNRHYTSFRTDQFDVRRNFGFPYTTAFVEYRPTSRTSIRFDAQNLSDTASQRDLIFFILNRADVQATVRDHRYRNNHVHLGLTLKQGFGRTGS